MPPIANPTSGTIIVNHRSSSSPSSPSSPSFPSSPSQLSPVLPSSPPASTLAASNKPRQGRNDHSESQPLLNAPGVPFGAFQDTVEASEDRSEVQSLSGSDRERAKRWDPVKRLDMGPTGKDQSALGMVLIGGVLFVGGTWYMVLTQNIKALAWFTPHPLLNSLSILLLILGILPLQPPPPTLITRRARFATHQGLILGLALPGLALGTASMWWNKHVHGAVHFTTWHAWFGLACLGWILAQSLLGFLSIHFPSLFGGPEKAKRVYKYHRLSGYILLAGLLFTAHLGGGHSAWAVGIKGAMMKVVRVGAFWVGTAALFVGVVVRMRTSKMQFRSGSR